MTELLSFLFTTHDPKVSQPETQLDDELIHILHTLGIDSEKDGENIWVWIPFSQIPQLSSQQFDQYGFYGSLQLNHNILDFTFAIHDNLCRQIRAKPGHQRTSMTKFSMAVNSLFDEFLVKVNPMSGEILLTSKLLFFGNQLPIQYVSNFFDKFEQQCPIILQVFELLEVVPIQNNLYISSLVKKMQPLKELISRTPNKGLIKSQNQQQHQNYFCINSQTQTQGSEIYMGNIVQKMRKIYVEEFSSRFMYSNARFKETNFSYWNVDNTPENQKVIQKMRQYQKIGVKLKKSKKESVIVEGRKIYLKFQEASPERIRNQYMISENICKKKIYLPFMRDYIVLRNHLDLRKSYLITKQNDEASISIAKYLKMNKKTISLQTRLKLMAQIICIAYICIVKNTQLIPSFSLSNLFLDEKYCIKLQNICYSQKNSTEEIIQSLYNILTNKRYFYLSENENKQDSIKQQCLIMVEDERLMGFGPSVMVKTLLKVFNNMKNQQKLSCQGHKISPSILEDSLLIITRFLDIIQKESTAFKK